MGRRAGVALLAVALSTLPSIPVWAQGAGGIAGHVRFGARTATAGQITATNSQQIQLSLKILF